MRLGFATLLALHLLPFVPSPRLSAQPYGPPDRGEPGDIMIQAYLAGMAEGMDAKIAEDIRSAEEWEKHRPGYKEEYLYMLGLWPLSEKTPLRATVTGVLDRGEYRVEKLHYQSVPGLYVTANLYRPSASKPSERLPAVLYVCGHSGKGRNGNKTAYQSHGIWFARHGYVCLVLDTLQLGEIAGIHHGAYREGRWWWYSRGYTPAGVECWNGVRGIDYLQSRPDVDAERIAVTGISGGGAATFWIAAADERARVAVPVSGMADLASYVSNRVINGHCDCMFLHNTFQWPWTRIAALIAPRPLLFVNSDQDPIFPMDANDRVIARLERIYALSGCGDRVDAVVSLGGHAYRKDIRQAAYRFIDAHLKGDAREVSDSEVDLVVESGGKSTAPIPLEELRVFPNDSDIPGDARNATIDRAFVPMANVKPPERGAYASWKAGLLAELRRVTFRSLPERVPPAKEIGRPESGRADGPWLETEPGIRILVDRPPPGGSTVERILLVIRRAGDEPALPTEGIAPPDDHLTNCWPRGMGETRWTQKNPPNYVARSHVLVGTTVDTGRVRDVIAVARYLKAARAGTEVWVLGHGADAAIAAYAALLDDDISGAILLDPPATHMDPGAPPFLNVLRVCDIPDVLGMLAPRKLVIRSASTDAWAKTQAIYEAAGAAEALAISP